MKRAAQALLLAISSCSPGDGTWADQGAGGSSDGSVMTDLMERPGPQPSAAKLPHLIIAATGEDLGLLLDLKTLTFYSEKAGAPITLGLATAEGISPTIVSVAWEQVDCKGSPYVHYAIASPGAIPRLQNLFYFMTADGEFGRTSGPQRDVAIRSQGTSTQCTNIGLQVYRDQVDFVGSGVRLRRFTERDLKIELR